MLSSLRKQSARLRGKLPAAPEGMVYVAAGPAAYGEDPSRLVSLSPFFIDAKEVSSAQYAAYAKIAGIVVPEQGRPIAEDIPVVNVSLDEARAYCASKGKILPDRWQWRLAAGTPARDKVWDFLQSGRAVHPSGRLAPAACGAYDLYGNVWEWIEPAGAKGNVKEKAGGSWDTALCFGDGCVAEEERERAQDLGFRCASRLEHGIGR